MKQRNWQAILLRIAVVLGALLVILVAIALLYIVAQVLLHFGNVLALFIVGAIIAYVLNPAVNRITALVGRRWLGMLAVYAGAAVVLAILAVSLIQPLATESSSLVRALRHPTAGSMRALTRIADQSRSVGTELRAQRVMVEQGSAIPRRRVHLVQLAIAGIQTDLTAVGAPPVNARRPPVKKPGTTPEPRLRIPPSYLALLQRSTAALASDYQLSVHDPTAPALAPLTRAIADADSISALRTAVSTTPIMVLDAQTWADQHRIGVNVQQSGGQVIKKVSDQAASLLNNTASILSQTATLLLGFVLILIISVYFVMDGRVIVQNGVALVPDAYRARATFFVSSLDSILGNYIRGQILLAILAGILGGVGAAVLGVPYPLVIGASTFVLQLLPVIGPILVYIVPTSIALIFTSMPIPLILLGYYIVMEQVVTNVIGPRVNSKSVGIHPLEAMAAALVGYAIGGFLASFLSVPLVGLIHVLIKEAYASWRVRGSSSTASTDAPAQTVAGVGDESMPARQQTRV